MNYYFLLSSLPDVQIGVQPQLSFAQLKELLKLNLTEGDQKKVEEFLLYIDLKNVRSFWRDKPIDPRGNLSEKELDEALSVKDHFPSYLFSYMEEHPGKEERLHFFTKIFCDFFNEKKCSPFLEKYFSFERELRLILVALRAKEFKKDIAKELQFEDPKDSFIAYILTQKDAEEFDPPQEYIEAKKIFKETLKHPKELAKAFLEYRFDKIEEMEENKPFHIDQVLGYAARLLFAEYWYNLDENEGIEFISSIA